MDPTEDLSVRFHFLGEFVNEGRDMQYVGGRTEMSHIDRDKISLPEIKGHLADHVRASKEQLEVTLAISRTSTIRRFESFGQ